MAISPYIVVLLVAVSPGDSRIDYAKPIAVGVATHCDYRTMDTLWEAEAKRYGFRNFGKIEFKNTTPMSEDSFGVILTASTAGIYSRRDVLQMWESVKILSKQLICIPAIRIKQQSRASSNNSFKPTPLRGAA